MTALTTAPGAALVQPPMMTTEQVELLKRTICRDATDDELEMFMHTCTRTGLDPFARQIHAVKRWDSGLKRNVMSMQVGIDGFRLIADRTGKYAGSDDAVFMEDNDGPIMATVTVYKLVQGERCAFSKSARFAEYVQTKKDGTPNSMWNKMPFGQLAKCAEALALRTAFPAELSGLYTQDEMGQAENQPAQPKAPQAPQGKAGKAVEQGLPKDAPDAQALLDRVGAAHGAIKRDFPEEQEDLDAALAAIGVEKISEVGLDKATNALEVLSGLYRNFWKGLVDQVPSGEALLNMTENSVKTFRSEYVGKPDTAEWRPADLGEVRAYIAHLAELIALAESEAKEVKKEGADPWPPEGPKTGMDPTEVAAADAELFS